MDADKSDEELWADDALVQIEALQAKLAAAEATRRALAIKLVTERTRVNALAALVRGYIAFTGETTYHGARAEEILALFATATELLGDDSDG